MTYRLVTYAELLQHAHTLGIRVTPWENCKPGDLIGQGGSMLVYEGNCKINGEERRVAFKYAKMVLTEKTPKSTRISILSDIRQEIRMMGRLKGQPHIL